MPKSKIIKDAVEDKVSLETSLNRLLILAKDVNNSDLEQWAKNELKGYGNNSEIPDYRKHVCGNFRYSGINYNMQIGHSPLTAAMMGADLYEEFSKVTIRDPIKALIEFSVSKNPPAIDVTNLASIIYKRSGGGIQCTSIEQIIPQALFQRIIADVKERIISFFYELEKEYGSLDDLDIGSTHNRSSIEAHNTGISRMIKNDVSTVGKKVFIVHGHDNELKETVARAIAKAGLTEVILHEQPDGGRTIIEKLEHYASEAAYAIILYTGCDYGRAKDAGDDMIKPRARQNVVFEHGLFMGRLGRNRVCALVKNAVEKPGDIDGILYIDVDEGGGWKIKLAQNMKEAGIEFDYEGMLQ